jgi:hypothetical protein
MTRSTQKNLAAYEGTWFGNIHGNNLQDPWSKKEVSQTDWLEVRVLPAPPRSPAQTGISRFSVNRPELAAICAHILSLQSANWIAGTFLGSLSLPWKIAFPDGGGSPW